MSIAITALVLAVVCIIATFVLYLLTYTGSPSIQLEDFTQTGDRLMWNGLQIATLPPIAPEQATLAVINSKGELDVAQYSQSVKCAGPVLATGFISQSPSS
jgi:hypothetical protein